MMWSREQLLMSDREDTVDSYSIWYINGREMRDHGQEHDKTKDHFILVLSSQY